MIDIFSLVDKNGKRLFNLNSQRNDKAMYSLNSLLLKFPGFQIAFDKKFSYSNYFGDDMGIDGELGADEYFEIEDHASIRVINGKKDSNVGLGVISEHLNSEDEARQKFENHFVTEQDVNRAVRMAMAYQYMVEHIQQHLAAGRSKEELMHLPYDSIVHLELKKDIKFLEFEREMQIALRHSTSTEDRAQALLDETFGAGTVDLDEYIKSQVDALMAQQEEAAQRKAEKVSIVEKFKGGFAKLLTPVRMLSQKLSEKKEFNRLVKNETVGTKWEIERKAQILEEEFSEL